MVVTQAATGCIRTTQVPQLLLDQCASKGAHSNIVAVQPRMSAAISVAHRVCQEGWLSRGCIADYQVGLDSKPSGLDSKPSADTRLTYVTTGLLLARLVAKKIMSDYTNVVISELKLPAQIHEENPRTDFLPLVVREFLRTNSKNVKVILVSLTFDVDIFSGYIATRLPSTMRPLSC